MLVTTTDTVQNQSIETYLGIVTAEVVYGTNVFKDFFAGIRDTLGGRTGSYEKVFEKGQQKAIEELKQRAQKLNADGVIGIEIDTGTISVDNKGVLLLITATGTAVKFS
ncbi:MAG: YbjQ family protein [Pleurocapsa sp.]